MYDVSPAWNSTYPDAIVGILAMTGVANPATHSGLEAAKADLEDKLKARYDGWDRARLKEIPVLQAYDAYYKQFKKTYHVQLQLESVAFKGKSIPKVAALVEAMFMAELKDLLLTAGHDLEVIQPPVTIDVAQGHESYIRMNGDEQVLKAGDMMITDRQGVISSVIYGPDQRTRIRPETTRVLFTTYGPPGIESGVMKAHLEQLRDNVKLVSPETTVETLEILGIDRHA
ncbi:MAG: phenylalanine--tRNA ligase beta subunit-related protein [Anaerolineales bacterium]|jgi:DNA/RNA-binding domain of Phe-tRNA-synthetase-like protein